MKIESSSFRIRDDYGLFIEVKSIIEIPSEEASKEVFDFFSKYRIVAVHRDINVIDKHKEELATSKKELIKEDTLVRPAKGLPMKQLIYIVKKLIPTSFCSSDFLNYMNSKEEYDAYTLEDKKKMWTSVYANLKRNKKIELVSKKGRKRDYKYRYIGIDNPEDDVRLKIASLMNGEKVCLDKGE